MLRGFWVIAAFAFAACAQPKSVPVIGPDGSAMFHVSCGGDEAKCFELAGRVCPTGYEIHPTPGRNYLVRCREPGYVAVVSRDGSLAPSPYTTMPGPNTQGLAPNPYRPPPTASAPAPPSTATFPPLTTAPQRSKGEDLGY